MVQPGQAVGGRVRLEGQQVFRVTGNGGGDEVEPAADRGEELDDSRLVGDNVARDEVPAGMHHPQRQTRRPAGRRDPQDPPQATFEERIAAIPEEIITGETELAAGAAFEPGVDGVARAELARVEIHCLRPVGVEWEAVTVDREDVGVVSMGGGDV